MSDPVTRGDLGCLTTKAWPSAFPDAYEQALARPHAREMDFTGRPLRGMVYVAEAGVRSDRSLRGWIERGVVFAGSLPPK